MTQSTAGKPTTIGVLTTRVRPSSGSASIDGVDVAADPQGVKRRIAVMPQRANLDRALTARENLGEDLPGLLWPTYGALISNLANVIDIVDDVATARPVRT